MVNFWPTTANDIVGLIVMCITAFGSMFGGFGFLLNKYVTKPLKEMRADLNETNAAHSQQLYEHEIRLIKMEGKVFTDED
ncbi:hypothetical protein OIT44_02765 [Weissella ceti]|uniref:Phage protein n=1 Tax=Weissella ceti TaxID=759620 RepID=A0ABT3E510_9LACO|nr:hypothetical protein [Weissella ceti]MCW0952993.1 hypothetical protein [Weissella ceti]QVK11539.1 hypothetical protein KHQ31_04775 [Weissella ceti]